MSVEIQLSNGGVALIDDADFPLVSRSKWYRKFCTHYSTPYVVSTDTRQVALHRLLLLPDPGQVCDHINGDGLDNRRCNIRVATLLQNVCNAAPRAHSSRYKGVMRQRGMWQARARLHARQYHLGFFDDEVEAALAYDLKAVELFGGFARLNFLRS